MSTVRVVGQDARYSNEDLAARLLANAGQSLEIVTYAGPDGKAVNVALENTDTCTVIIDFDLLAGDEEAGDQR